jgi:putative membrane protein
MSEQQSHRIRLIAGWAVVGLIVVIGASVVLSVLAFDGRGGFFPFHFGWLGGIFLLLIIFWIARWFFWPWRGRGWYRYEHRSAESILKERYARGEVTKEQFDQMMHDLRKAD